MSKKGQVRVCVPEDMPRVADLFQTILRGLSRPAPSSLQQYLLELFFKSPSHDPELPSLVYVGSDEAVGGFLGVIPLRMSFRGKPIRAAPHTRRGIVRLLVVDKPVFDDLRLLLGSIVVPWA